MGGSISAAIASIASYIGGAGAGASAGTAAGTGAGAISGGAAASTVSVGALSGTTAALSPVAISGTSGITASQALLASSLASAGVSAYGQIQAGRAAGDAANFNAAMQGRNAAISRENAQIAQEAGEAQAAMQGLRTRAIVGATVADQAASGIEVGQGSYRDVGTSERVLGEMDAKTIRSNASREAFSYRQKASSEDASSTLSRYEAKSAREAGAISAGATFLGGASSAASEYQKFQLQGGL